MCMCMHQLKVTSRVFLYDSAAAAITRIRRPSRSARAENKKTGRTTIRRSASHFDCFYGHPDSPQSIPESHYNKHEMGKLAAGMRTQRGWGWGLGEKLCVYIPALVWARKGPMAALGPLMAHQPVQSTTLKPTHKAVMHRPAPAPVPPSAHKAAFHIPVRVADGRLRVRLVPNRALYAVL